MLTTIDENIWIADGPSVPFFGFPYPTRMMLIRLGDGSIWVCSPIELSDELRSAVDALGPVRHIVSPNKVHHLFMGPWADAWPEAKMYASPGLARRRTDLRFDAELGDDSEAAWRDDIDQVIFRGSFALDEVVFFHRSSRSAIFTDLIQKFDESKLTGWRRVVMKLDGMVGENGSTPREWRWSFWNRKAARAARAKTLAWDPQRLLIAHGEWVRENGREVLARSLSWLG